jgi:hypothetical protein
VEWICHAGMGACSVDEETLVNTLANGLLNLLLLIFRSNDGGIRQQPLIKAMAYLVLVSTTVSLSFRAVQPFFQPAGIASA